MRRESGDDMTTKEFIDAKRSWLKKNRFDLSTREEVVELAQGVLDACDRLEAMVRACDKSDRLLASVDTVLAMAQETWRNAQQN